MMTDYYGTMLDLSLDQDRDALMAIRDIASENEDWGTVDAIDNELIRRRGGRKVRPVR